MRLKKQFSVFFILVIIMMGFIGYAYFFIVSSSFVDKPYVEKPGTREISFQHVAYFLNELGAYKLHPEPVSGKNPVIQLYIMDTGQRFDVKVEKGYSATELEPDIRINTYSLNVRQEPIDKGKIEVEMLSGNIALELKGYKNMVTGFTLKDEDAGSIRLSDLSNAMMVLFVCSLAIILTLVIEKE